ncbi:hypothetical protein ACFX1S_035667 [Malus domestica]
MNEFAQQAKSIGEGMARIVMSEFKPEVLPVYIGLANEFAVFDRWFASVPASTQPNRFYFYSATSHGAMSNVREDLIHSFPQKTIFDSLDENGLNFDIYYQNIPATLWEMNDMSPRVKEGLDERRLRKMEAGNRKARERERILRSAHSGSLPPHLSDPSHSPVSEFCT